jgi:hypothetical protein
MTRLINGSVEPISGQSEYALHQLFFEYEMTGRLFNALKNGSGSIQNKVLWITDIRPT